MNDIFIQELKNKSGLSTIVSRYVRLTYKNGHYIGCCPFHKEKTPSFTVNDAKGFYHCFGCNASGDVIGFLQNFLSISFMEAVSELCLQTNTPLPKFQKEQEKTTDLDILAHALILMQNELKKSPNAMIYLKKRSINDEIITNFGIGFCPPVKDFLFKNLRTNFAEEDILKSGLCIKSSYNNQIIDRFQNRIMFTIYSHSGKVIGFSGRIFNGEENVAKYINSPETALFKKSHILYNFHNARKTKDRFCIVTEGFMDTIAFYKDGIFNTVAQMGTAFTKNHFANLVARFEEVVFCLDGDTAGKKASEKVIELIFENLNSEKKFSFLTLDESKDPDEYLANNGKGSLQNLLAKRTPFYEFAWNIFSENVDFQNPASTLALEQKIFKIIRQNPDKSIQKHYEFFFKNKLYQSRFKKNTQTQIVPIERVNLPCLEYEIIAIAFFYAHYNLLQKHFENCLTEYEIFFKTQKIKDIIYKIENHEDVAGDDLIEEALNKNLLPNFKNNQEIHDFYMILYKTSMLQKFDDELKQTQDFEKIKFLILQKNIILNEIKNYTLLKS